MSPNSPNSDCQARLENDGCRYNGAGEATASGFVNAAQMFNTPVSSIIGVKTSE
jgi:hypothetical protein